MERELRNLRTKKKNIFERLTSDEKLEGEILKDIETAYNSFAEQEKQKQADIEKAQADKVHLSKVKEVSTRLSGLTKRFMGAGFSGMNFEQKQDFLRTLYPFRDKTYHIKVWKTDKGNFHWESTGRFTEQTLMGCFNIADDRGEEIETSIEYIIGREPTPDERKALAMFGLADKMAWKNSDIQRAEAIVEFCNADLTFFENCVDKRRSPVEFRVCHLEITRGNPHPEG